MGDPLVRRAWCGPASALANPVALEDVGYLVEVLVGGGGALLALGRGGNGLGPGRGRGARHELPGTCVGVLLLLLLAFLLLHGPAAQAPGDEEQQHRYARDDEADVDLGREHQAAEEVADRDPEPPQHLQDADQVQGDWQQGPGENARSGPWAAAAPGEPASDQSHGCQPATEEQPWDLAKRHARLPPQCLLSS